MELVDAGATGSGTELAQNETRSFASTLVPKGRELSAAACELLLLECPWLAASKCWLHWLPVSILYAEPNIESEDMELSVAGCELLLIECPWLQWLLVSMLYVEPNRESEDIELTVLAETGSSDISEVYKGSFTPEKKPRLARSVPAPDSERWLSDGIAPKESWVRSQSAMASTDRPLRSWHRTSFHFLLCARVLMTKSFEACW